MYTVMTSYSKQKIPFSCATVLLAVADMPPRSLTQGSNLITCLGVPCQPGFGSNANNELCDRKAR